jgi:amidohydrolase
MPTRQILLLSTAMMAVPAVLTGQQRNSTDPKLVAAIDRQAPAAIELRRQIHQNPELGNREVKTAALVADRLRALGLEVRTGIAHTGVVGILKGARPGPVLAVRADMDALPVTEVSDLPFKSTARTTYLGQEVGVSHACGHDLHVAIQLGVASTLATMRDQLRGTVVFVFQPAEEGVPPGERGGAELMVEEGVLRSPKVDAIFGLHVNGTMDRRGQLGTISYEVGPAAAASRAWYATVTGKPAHGAYPHLGVDPIVTASQVVLGLQTIRSRNLSPTTPSVATVGTFQGGERHNVIPQAVKLSGTIRSFSNQVQDSIERRMREVFDGITTSAGATFTLEFGQAYPVMVNDTVLTRRMAPSLERAVGAGNVLETQPEMGAEDFSFFAQEVPGFYFTVGALKAGTTSGGHHTPTFLADDSAVPIGMRAMTMAILDYLGGPRR